MTNAEPSPREQLKQAKLAAAQDRVALKELLAPVRGRTALAQLLQLIAAAATVVPFIGIVELGRYLLSGGPIDAARVWTIVAVFVGGGLAVRTLAGGLALTLTHHADVQLQAELRRRLVATLGRLPLGWFGATSSGEVRK